MFKHEYQGGPTVEILSCQGKDPLQKWKISGSTNGTAQLTYEKNVKGYAVQLEGSTVTNKMQLPKNGKKSLHLTQRYLILQVYVPLSKDFSIELAMTDTTGSKRRVMMSTSAREISITPLHAKLNISLVKRDTWLNLCLDLASLVSDIFLRQTFKCLDFLVIAGNCKVRKIFTMRNQPPDTTASDCESIEYSHAKQSCFQLENVPQSVQFSSTVMYMTQVITVPKIRSELSRSSKQKNLSSGGITSRTDSDLSRHTHDNQPSSRESTKSFASNPRPDKKPKRPASSESEKSARALSQKAVKATKHLDTTPDQSSILTSARSPFSLIQLVDDMEIRDSLDSGAGDALQTAVSDKSDVFLFSSKPHVAHERPKSATNRTIYKSDSLNEDLNYDQDEATTIQPSANKIRLKESNSLPILANGSFRGLSLRDSETTLISSAETLVQTTERSALLNCEGKRDSALSKYADGGEGTPKNVTISRKTIREIPPKPDASYQDNDFSSLPVDSWSESFDSRILSEMKREQEEEDLVADDFKTRQENVAHNDVDYDDESFDASWSTWKQPPGMDSEAYAGEMRGTLMHNHTQTLDLTLDESKYESVGSLPSPPIVLPSQRGRYRNDEFYASEAFGISDGSTVSGQSTSLNESDDEEMLDLMYDPCLNCYFDPKSGRYYELKG